MKCWQEGDHAERWVGSALRVAEGNFRRIKGYRDLPPLLAAVDQLKPKPPRRSGHSRVRYESRRVAAFNGSPDILVW